MAQHAWQKRNKMIQCVCEFCLVLCRSRREYVCHRTSVHPGEKYICKYCSRQHNSANGCYKHECTHTTPLSICQICGQIFKLPSELRDHFPVHNDQQKVSCENCGKLFATKRTLKRQSQVHMDLQFDCPACEHSFNTKDKVRRHY